MLPRFLDSDTTDIVANSEHSDLPEANRFIVGHAKGVQPGEVRTQDPGALMQALKGNDQYTLAEME